MSMVERGIFHAITCTETTCEPPTVYRWSVTTTGRLVERAVELPGCPIGDPSVPGGQRQDLISRS